MSTLIPKDTVEGLKVIASENVRMQAGVERENPFLFPNLSNQFLNPDETQSLRDELDRIKQSPCDSIPQFSRKLGEIADSAYSIRARNNDQ